MDVRIGIVQSMKELDIELPEDADRDKVLADIETALAEDGTILWLTDRKGRQVGVPVAKVAYVELDPPTPSAGSVSGSPDRSAPPGPRQCPASERRRADSRVG